MQPCPFTPGIRMRGLAEVDADPLSSTVVPAMMRLPGRS
jgi:hypothetical protein